MLTKLLLQTGKPDAAAGQRAVDRVLAERAARKGLSAGNKNVAQSAADLADDGEEDITRVFE